MEGYWATIADANCNAHVAPEFAVHIRVGTPASLQFAGIHKSLERLGELLENLRLKDESLNDEIRKHLETRGYDLTLYDALAVSNTYADLIVALKQTEVRFLEEYAKTHFDEVGVTEKLKAARAELHQMAISAGYVD
jgi:hypothetical protein